MPQRSSRNNNNNTTHNGRNTNKRTNESRILSQLQQQHRTSPPPSPPTHLPTPLPDEQLLSLRASSSVMEYASSLTGLGINAGDPTRLVESETGVDGGDRDRDASPSTSSLAATLSALGTPGSIPTRLIDFDTPPPARSLPLPGHAEDPEGPHYLQSGSDDLQDELEVDAEGLESTYTYEHAGAYRSPPFREAQLPEKQDSPPPLPILPPRASAGPYHEGRDDFAEESAEDGFVVQGSVSRNATIRVPRVGPGHRSSLSSPNVATTPSSSSSSRPTSVSPASPAPRSRFGIGGLPFDAFSIGQALRSSYASPAPPAPPSVSRPVVGHGVFASGSAQGQGSQQAQQQQHRRAVSQQEFEREYERYGEGDGGEYYGYSAAGAGGGGGYGSGYRQPQPAPQAQASSQPPQAEEYEYGAGQAYPVASPRPQPREQLYQQHQPPSQSPPYRGQGQGQGSGLARAMRREASGGGGYGAYPEQEVHGQYRPDGGGGRGLRQSEREERKADVITWARWDVLNDRRVLLIAYPTSLQIWDCADLKKVKEVLDIDFSGAEWSLLAGDSAHSRTRVAHAAVLPPPKLLPAAGKGPKVEELDAFKDVRPLLGVLMESTDEDEREPGLGSTTFVLYSLRNHQIVKMLSLDGRAVPAGTGADGFIANEFVVVIGTASPPRIQVLSALTFQTLHVIHSDALEPFHRPSAASQAPQHSISSTLGVPAALSPATSGSSQPSLASTGLLSLDRSNSGAESPSSDSLPYPVFALSRRLLAYASPSPGSSSPSSGDAQHSNLFSTLSSKARRRLSSSSNTTSASGPSSSHGGASSSISSSPFGGLGGAAAAGIGKLTGMSTITQADVGHAALKVGESVLGGMRFLGGLAVEAAKSRVSGSPVGGAPRPLSVGSASAVGGGGGKFVSRSAPDNVADEMLLGRDKRYSAGTASTPTSTAAPQTRQTAEQGYYVTVLDLAPLLSGDPSRDPRSSPPSVSRSASRSPDAAQTPTPRKVDEFMVSRSQPVAGLSFSEDGISIAVASRDGHNVKVFKLNPAPGVMVAAYQRTAGSSSAVASSPEDSSPPELPGIPGPLSRPPTQLYELHRGRTSAVIEGVRWSRDGKWVGVGTRNRTVHVFGVNPFGLKPDVVWHLGGRVKDGVVSGTEPKKVQMSALARIRPSRTISSTKSTTSPPAPSSGSSPSGVIGEFSRAPLTFIFVPTTELSTTLQPPSSPLHNPVVSSSFSPSLSPSSPALSSASPPVHGHSTNRPTVSRQQTPSSAHQDVLLFDPMEGILSLRRLTLDKRSVKEGVSIPGLSGGAVGAAAAHALGVTSISLPGLGGAGKLSSSPSKAFAPVGGRDVRRGDQDYELSAKENMIVWWDLMRGREGGSHIKIAFEPISQGKKGKGRAIGNADWLSQGEINTCSSSQIVLPRSLYLSHQFSFQTLGEDYHALIRRYQFDVRGERIDVRKEVEVVSAFSPSSAGGGSLASGAAEAFVEDFDMQAPSRHARRVSSSFDEPMASAISASLQVDSANLPLILPMYPNGVPGSASGPALAFPHKVLRNAIPIGKGIGRNVNVVGEGLGRIVSASVGKRGRERQREGGYSLNDDHGELHVPLEFEEEDEDFMLQGGENVPAPVAPRQATASDSSRDTSLVTPSNSSLAHSMMDADVVGRVDEEIWGDDLSSAPPVPSAAGTGHLQEGSLEDDPDFSRGWDRQDRLAVEEQEGYDDLGVVTIGGQVRSTEEGRLGRGGAAEKEADKERRRKGKARKR